MGRKKSVPGPLTLTHQPAVAQQVPFHAPASAPAPVPMTGTSRSPPIQQAHSSQSQWQWQSQTQSQWPSQSQSQSHSAKLVPTLGFSGETQRLSPEAAASISTSTTSTSISTASLSVSSVSPKSPRFPYTSKFSPKNLIHKPSKSPLLSPEPSQDQLEPRPRPNPPSKPPPSIPRKAVPQPKQEAPTRGTIPQHNQHQHSHPHPHPNPLSHSHQLGFLPQAEPSSTRSSASTQQRPRQQGPSNINNSRSQESLTSVDSKQLHIAELHQRFPPSFPPITKAATASTHQQSHHHHQAERRLKSSHGRRPADEKPASIPHSANNHPLLQHQDHNHSRKQAFFFNFSNKSANSHDRLPPESSPPQAVPLAQSQSPRAAMSATEQPATTKQSSKQSDTAYAPASSLPSQSETALGDGEPSSTPASTTKKASKPKPFTLLSRTKSAREKNGRSPRHTPSPQDTKDAVPVPTPTQSAARVPIMELNPPDKAHVTQTPRTATTMPHDAGYREAMSSASRNHSADRAHSRDASSDRRAHQERGDHSRSYQSTPKDGASSFFNNLRREGGRVAETIGKGLFGKGGRSASTTERDPIDDEHYLLKVITLPLVEQTRLTRISKRLEESRDKTEFWMPAFPWRAIDYLNYKGCDVEGLYRVPGSGPQIKKWQRRFDEQHDVDLFTQEDLYDINIIGSMLKAWLRELPDELFPKEAQDRIARECSGSEKVPQMLVDELSNLSPFNYYLLFAITCHLSLLLAHSDKNKMDFRNLCICFQPCMKIDAFCFKFLVCDWRDCWKGCRTEARYIEEEYKLFDQPPPPGLGIKKRLEPRVEGQPVRRPSPAPDRDLSSADSNGKRSQSSGDQAKLKKKSPPTQEHGRENGSAAAVPRIVKSELDSQGSARRSNDRGPVPQDADDMRPLSPIKPLSPLGF